MESRHSYHSLDKPKKHGSGKPYYPQGKSSAEVLLKSQRGK